MLIIFQFQVTGIEGLVRSMKQQYDTTTPKSNVPQSKTVTTRRDSDRGRHISSPTSDQHLVFDSRWGGSSPVGSSSSYASQQEQRVSSPIAASSASNVQSQPPARKISADTPPALPSSPPPNLPTSPPPQSFTPYSGAKPRGGSEKQETRVERTASFEQKQTFRGLY